MTIASVWPEFAAISAEATVADLMRHQSGCSGFSRPVQDTASALAIFSDPAQLSKFLIEQGAEWGWAEQQGALRRQAYNALTRGFFASQLVRRVDPAGRTLAKFFQEEVVVPCGVNGQVFIGCPPEAQHRVAWHEPASSLVVAAAKVVLHRLAPAVLLQLLYGTDADHMDKLFDYEVGAALGIASSPLARRAFVFAEGGGFDAVGIANSPEVRAVPMPSATGVCSARGIAAITGALAAAGGAPALLSRTGLKAALGVRASEEEAPLLDEVLGRTVRYTACGWGADRFSFCGCPGWVGWAGAGGSLNVFHLESETAVAYVPTRLASRLFKPRAVRLLKAVMRSLNLPEGPHSTPLPADRR